MRVPSRPQLPVAAARRATAAALALVVVGALVTPTAQAAPGPEDRKKQVDASIGALKNDLSETSADLVGAYQALEQTKARLPGARANLAAAEQAVSDAAERDADLGRQLAVSQAAEAKASDELQGADDEAASTTDVLGGIARTAYQTNGMGELSVALQAQTADDFATRLVLVDTAQRIQGDALTRLAVLRADTVAARLRLAAVRRQTALLKAQAAANLITAQDAASAAARAKARVDALLQQRQSQVSAVGDRKTAESRKLTALQQQSRALGAQLAEIARQARLKAAREKAAREKAAARAREAAARKAAARKAAIERAADEARRKARIARSRAATAAGAAPRQEEAAEPADTGFVSGGYLTTPVAGSWVSSEFGQRYHPILHYWRLHAGIDFAVGCGTPVRAAAEGTIVSAGWGGGYGNRVVIDNGLVGGTGLATTYNHLTSIVVSSGSVSRGQLIGYSGTTGSSTGCHLHFETYENGTPVNPRRWM